MIGRKLMLLGVMLVAAPVMAQQPSGLKREYLGELDHASKQLVALAEAMPAEKYSWRPAEGVRSVSEVYMHVAGGNFMLLGMLGVKPPPGMSREMEKTITDKAQVIDWLKRSLEAARTSFANASDADLDKPAKFFGRDTTARGIYLRILVHINEHMGQSVAYARVNGVVPPWSASEPRN